MNSRSIRQKFLDFFNSKGHSITDSAPMVVKQDPTLMFTNAGMNQFKDIFLGNSPAKHSRVANTQKCLRVSGKHNDLEEVGHDTYHHTMFEMLGNWSFGDYFKKEAISWAWELLVTELGISSDRLYATIFKGNKEEGIEMDSEALNYWKAFMPEDRILAFSKKDNFWEMGDTGPCGPCSEIHIDIRTDEERKKQNGRELVNKDHPKVIELWNLVFIQYNRKSDGILEPLPHKHIDTGMGFERLCMVMQNKQSNYDTDLFQAIIGEVAKRTGIPYGEQEQTDIAMRVVADHLRAVAFAITDGQLPSNAKAGYVIRRILRRAIRYYYSFLDRKKPLIYQLVNVLIEQMGEAFPELKAQKGLIENVINDEEQNFLRTLESGIRLLEGLIEDAKKNKKNIISGKRVFELYDTFGFPFDLTELILREQELQVNHQEFDNEMIAQKARSRQAAEMETGDWIILRSSDEQKFEGYDKAETDIFISRYREVVSKEKEYYQLVFDHTPFYGESGGQVGDTGLLQSTYEKIPVIDTVKENNLIIHITRKLPDNLSARFRAIVDYDKRIATACNHTATHLLHYSLREVLGKHVEQKGSLVHPDYLRFDFSHFQKISEEELSSVEKTVNRLIRQNINLEEYRNLPISEARKMGAMALFGEKYGEEVRVIRFGDSVELCGGIHVHSTGQIGIFKIISETSIASGIRRIQAYTAGKAEDYINTHLGILSDISEMLDSPNDIKQSIKQLSEQNAALRKKLEEASQQDIKRIKNNLKDKLETLNGINIITQKITAENPGIMKDLAFQMRNETENLLLILGAEIHNKAHLSIILSDDLAKGKNLNANKMIKELAKEIRGGGGGQPFYATAGGGYPEGIDNALAKAREMVKNL